MRNEATEGAQSREGDQLTDGDVRNRTRMRVAQWQATLAQLRNERRSVTGKVPDALIERLRELQAKIADEIRHWNVGIDEYDADPSRTTQREFGEDVSLREIEKQIRAEIALALSVGHDVG
jgi:hypothetical protein